MGSPSHPVHRSPIIPMQNTNRANPQTSSTRVTILLNFGNKPQVTLLLNLTICYWIFHATRASLQGLTETAHKTADGLTAHTKTLLSTMATDRGRWGTPVAMRRVPERVEWVAVLQGWPVGLSKATVCGTPGPRLHARRTVAFTGPHWGRHHAGRTVGEDAVCSLQTPRSPLLSEKEKEGKERRQKKCTIKGLSQWFLMCEDVFIGTLMYLHECFVNYSR